jgi:hypothetical protein
MLFPEALAYSPSALNTDRFHAVYCHVYRITFPLRSIINLSAVVVSTLVAIIFLIPTNIL